MNVVKHLVVAASLSLLGSAALAADPATPGGFEIGVLTCTSDAGTQENRIINSKVQVSCILKYNKGKQERYVGETGIGVGLDLNWKRNDTLVYTVLAGSQDTTPGAGALAGKFVGGKGSVTLGVGGGVGVLVGGSSTNLTLQPLTLEGSKGLGIAGGVSYLTLKLAD
ncbi:DUF992 domain-containing protein [uncultured Thiodictyon sp.]|uniref:DUF992 domain-containing protein n=1 Tax=uncultured Thiodictyon sp. TaxID=1846217 RepID=UPI0025D9B12A|nr:DUF992 domain-containing protein [uncultured Thiodictyon sp.]